MPNARLRLALLLPLLACEDPAPDGPSERTGAPEPEVPAPVDTEPDLASRPAPPEGAPNLLFVSLDTTRADRLGVYGGRAETPNLTALAARGARFDQAISHFPETCHSHWSMFTGILPEAHGNVPRLGDSRYGGPTMAQLAQAQGYVTGAFVGGYTLTARYCATDRGFDLYDDQFDFDRSDLKRPGSEITARATAWITEQRAVAEAERRPWMALVHYFEPHHPYTPDSPWDTAYTDPDYQGSVDGTTATMGHFRGDGEHPSAADIAQALALYDGELTEVDSYLAPLLQAAGEDTLVVLTADHGESFGHEYWFNHAQSLWDEVLHVPLIMAGPGVPEGVVVPEQVGLVDLLPTLGALSPLEVPDGLHGTDLSALLRGEGSGRAEVFAVTDPWRPPTWFAVRTQTHKVVWPRVDSWVVDRRTDPLELDPTAPLPPDLADARSAYEAELARVAPLLSEDSPDGRSRREIAPEERARLEALGYMEPGGGVTPGPSGKAGKAGKGPGRGKAGRGPGRGKAPR